MAPDTVCPTPLTVWPKPLAVPWTTSETPPPRVPTYTYQLSAFLLWECAVEPRPWSKIPVCVLKPRLTVFPAASTTPLTAPPVVTAKPPAVFRRPPTAPWACSFPTGKFSVAPSAWFLHQAVSPRAKQVVEPAATRLFLPCRIDLFLDFGLDIFRFLSWHNVQVNDLILKNFHHFAN